MTENTNTGSQTPAHADGAAKGTHWSKLGNTASHRMHGQVNAPERDWGKWIEENKSLLGILSAFVIVVVLAGGYFYNARNKSKEEYNSKIDSYVKTQVEKFKVSTNAVELVQAFKELHKSTGDYIGLVPAVIKTSDALIAQGKKEEALEVLKVGSNLSHNDYVQFFMNARLAAVYEDMGKNAEAIEVLNKLTGADVKVFEGKFYLDLGRVYLKMGNVDKAKASFQFVVDKAKDEAEFVKIAKLQLANLK